MQEIKHRVNKDEFGETLKSKGISQVLVAEKLNINPKSFSRWINEGFVYSKYLWDLTELLDLSDEELKKILMIPRFEVFFRKKFLGSVPEDTKERAIELAKVLFRLTFLHANARFCPPNASTVENSIEVANQIRKYTGIHEYSDLRGIVSCFAGQGVEIAVIPFAKMGIGSDNQQEKAFSVTDGSRCLIFLDANSPEEELIFNLCHELCHLFRPEVEPSKTEERFCREVASELVYPMSFFIDRKELISRVLEGGSIQKIMNLIEAIQDSLGGEPFGIILRLKELGFLSQKNMLHRRLLGFGRKICNSLPKIEDKFFNNFNPSNRKKFIDFWDNDNLKKSALMRFFSHIKNGATDESISPRKFSELFQTDLSIVDEMIHKWRLDLNQSVRASSND